MDLKELSKKLEYKKVSDLYVKYNLTASSVSHMKKRNAAGYNDLMNKIILDHYEIGVDELLVMIDLYKVQHQGVSPR